MGVVTTPARAAAPEAGRREDPRGLVDAPGGGGGARDGRRDGREERDARDAPCDAPRDARRPGDVRDATGARDAPRDARDGVDSRAADGDKRVAGVARQETYRMSQGRTVPAEVRRLAEYLRAALRERHRLKPGDTAGMITVLKDAFALVDGDKSGDLSVDEFVRVYSDLPGHESARDSVRARAARAGGGGGHRCAPTQDAQALVDFLGSPDEEGETKIQLWDFVNFLAYATPELCVASSGCAGAL